MAGFMLEDKQIWRWNNNANEWYPIADVIDSDSCRRLVRASRFADDVEDLCDGYIGDILRSEIDDDF